MLTKHLSKISNKNYLSYCFYQNSYISIEKSFSLINKNDSIYLLNNSFSFDNILSKYKEYNNNKNFNFKNNSYSYLSKPNLKKQLILNFSRNRNDNFFQKTQIFNFCNKEKMPYKDELEAGSENIEKNFLKLDYYSMLNLKHNFSENELRKNYVHLAKNFHPDRFKGSPEIFKKLSEAYQTLKDDNKREDYNRKLKIKINKNYKKNKYHAGDKNEMNQEELRNASKYEEDFKKLNIDKLFHEFANKKVKTSHEKIKTYKSNLEKKMNPREFKTYELVLEFKQNQLLSKDAKYKFYKEFGLIKENKIEKDYSQLVKEEIDRIKNKNNLYEKIKEREKEEESNKEQYSTNLKKFMTRLFIFYILSILFVLYSKYKNTKIAEENMKKKIESDEQRRFSNYVYIGNSKI